MSLMSTTNKLINYNKKLKRLKKKKIPNIDSIMQEWWLIHKLKIFLFV